MFRNFLNNLGKRVYGSFGKFYSNTINNGINNPKKFQLIEALKKEFKDISSPVSHMENNEIRNMEFEEWEQRVMLLKNYGFNDRSCFTIIKNYPTVLNIPKETLVITIKQWNHCNLEQHNVLSILSCQPHFLSLPVNEIRKRIAYFHSISKSKTTISVLIIENPNVMTDDWKSILAKIDYLQKTKRIPQSQILHSKSLSKPLDFIKLRIDVLEKCGIFKVIKTMPHKTKIIKHENPKLNKITDLKDKNFAQLIAHITEEEYKTYSEFFSYMNSNNVELNDDYDDDDDE